MYYIQILWNPSDIEGCGEWSYVIHAVGDEELQCVVGDVEGIPVDALTFSSSSDAKDFYNGAEILWNDDCRIVSADMSFKLSLPRKR